MRNESEVEPDTDSDLVLVAGEDPEAFINNFCLDGSSEVRRDNENFEFARVQR